MHAPRTDHSTAVHRILKYLKGSPGQGILYKSHGHAKAMAFTDSDWAGSLTDRKLEEILFHGKAKNMLLLSSLVQKQRAEL